MKTMWYMGAKTRLVPDFLRAAIDHLTPRDGLVVDAFAGTGIVSADLAGRYTVWANDVQEYSAALLRSLIAHEPSAARSLSSSLDFDEDLGAAFEDHRKRLGDRLGGLLEEESRLLDGALDGAPPEAYRAFLAKSPLYPNRGSVAPAWRDFAPLLGENAVGAARARRRRSPGGPEELCFLATAYYQGVYFGLQQAVDIDSMRYAIDRITGPEAEGRRRHYLAALICAASVSTSGTSHFAQPRSLRLDRELRAVARRRRSDIVGRVREFSEGFRRFLAEVELRPGNQVFVGDHRSLLERLGPVDTVYADPPYTADNYSRFYHVLEVLTRYDYPELLRRAGAISKGRYPVSHYRFQSGFCSPKKVEGEFRSLAQGCAASGTNLALSYSSPTGLLIKRLTEKHGQRRALRAFLGLFKDSFESVTLRRRSLMHSGQGDSNHEVTELLVLCRKPRSSS